MRRRELTSGLYLAMGLPILSLFTLFGCGKPLDSFDPVIDGSARVDGADQDAAQGPFVNIYIEGDLSEKTFTDSLSGQTPSVYTLWLSRFDLMRSETDPEPVVLEDHGQDYVSADLIKDRTRIARVRAASVPFGTYSHGRALFIAVEVTVAATLHFMGNPMVGDLDIFGVLSDCVFEEEELHRDDVTYTFGAQSMSGVLPTLPSSPIGTIDRSEAGRTWLVLTFPEPLAVFGEPASDQDITVVCEIYESFRWEDQDLAGYQPDVFDINPPSYEPVMSFGASGYRIELR